MQGINKNLIRMILSVLIGVQIKSADIAEPQLTPCQKQVLDALAAGATLALPSLPPWYEGASVPDSLPRVPATTSAEMRPGTTLPVLVTHPQPACQSQTESQDPATPGIFSGFLPASQPADLAYNRAGYQFHSHPNSQEKDGHSAKNRPPRSPERKVPTEERSTGLSSASTVQTAAPRLTQVAPVSPVTAIPSVGAGSIITRDDNQYKQKLRSLLMKIHTVLEKTKILFIQGDPELAPYWILLKKQFGESNGAQYTVYPADQIVCWNLGDVEIAVQLDVHSVPKQKEDAHSIIKKLEVSERNVGPDRNWTQIYLMKRNPCRPWIYICEFLIDYGNGQGPKLLDTKVDSVVYESWEKWHRKELSELLSELSACHTIQAAGVSWKDKYTAPTISELTVSQTADGEYNRRKKGFRQYDTLRLSRLWHAKLNPLVNSLLMHQPAPRCLPKSSRTIQGLDLPPRRSPTNHPSVVRL